MFIVHHPVISGMYLRVTVPDAQQAVRGTFCEEFIHVLRTGLEPVNSCLKGRRL
jgi:hypothetical protein